MVGLIDPNPPKQPEKPPTSSGSLWEAFLNPVQVKLPPKGRYSPKIDERCFTWCSQSVRGRYENQDPWCRSLCIRRVFAHEVQQLTSHFSRDSVYHLRARGGKCAGTRSEVPAPAGRPARECDQGVRYWQEGWYIWMSKHRWAAQERLDLMMLDLEKQTNWIRMKESEEHAWAEQERPARPAVIPDGQEQEGHEWTLPHPLPYSPEDSFLVRVPSKLPPFDVLGIVRTSFESGQQKELAIRFWETAWSGASFILVKKVYKTWVDLWRRGPKDEPS
ncbi:hypothetical protein DFH11DRAFT_1840844 [Phellopilus nigrolimitatus]|nr:hypothetical protein DFH11DRAFT_1840844 [Phellopilus nigrolimitatus]